MIIDISDVQIFSKIADRIAELNESTVSMSSEMTAHIFQIDTTTTLDNGDHPVVASTFDEFCSYVVAEPTGKWEETYKNNKHIYPLFHLMQSEDESKTSAPFFDFTHGTFHMVESVFHEVHMLQDESFIGVVYPDDGIKGNPLFVVRFDEETSETVVEVFDIKFDVN